jgi:hypothetical protein
MKKQTIVAVILCIMTVLLAACSPADKAGGSAAPSAAQTVSPSVQAQPTEPSGEPDVTTAPTTGAEMNTGAIDLGRVSFAGDFDEFFGGDAKAALQRMEPILLAAAQAAYASRDIMMGTPDAASQWAVMYQYLNTYGDADFAQQEDGTLMVGQDSMLSLFRSIFGADAALPELKTDYNIRYDASAEQYLIGRSDFGEVTFAMTDLALSDTAAFITLTADGGSGAQFDVMIEITPGADAKYGYSILQITQLCGYT